MYSSVQPWFADTDTNLVALAAIGIIAFLVWEFVRERRSRRTRNKDRTVRERSRGVH
jgi:hypothetical protein